MFSFLDTMDRCGQWLGIPPGGQPAPAWWPFSRTRRPRAQGLARPEPRAGGSDPAAGPRRRERTGGGKGGETHIIVYFAN